MKNNKNFQTKISISTNQHLADLNELSRENLGEVDFEDYGNEESNLTQDAFGNEPNSSNPEDEGDKAEPSTSNSNDETEDENSANEDSSSEHDGKYFVIQKGKCQCNQGFQFPSFKVTSHQKHDWNDEKGKYDYLAVTEDDLTLNPPVMPFGNCKLKPSSGGYLPCTYAPAGKWTKTYDKVKVMGKSCVTEISELMCSIGGKITILKHGQQSEAGKSHVNNANSDEMQIYNPIVDFEEFKEEIDDDYCADYE